MERFVYPPSRKVVNADALAWLSQNCSTPGMSVITSLPDVSEIPKITLHEWQKWFVETVDQIIRWIPDDAVAIFYQSDIRQNGYLINKAFLVMQGAQRAGAQLMWHKIICRKPPGTIAMGRPSYSHMLCISRNLTVQQNFLGADVIVDGGYMTWSRAMGLNACEIACRYLRDATPTRIVVDPFCGKGSVLAVANNFGFNAIGIDLSASRCRSATRIRGSIEAMEFKSK